VRKPINNRSFVECGGGEITGKFTDKKTRKKVKKRVRVMRTCEVRGWEMMDEKKNFHKTKMTSCLSQQSIPTCVISRFNLVEASIIFQSKFRWNSTNKKKQFFLSTVRVLRSATKKCSLIIFSLSLSLFPS
jgi:hypothetical protein